MTLAQRLGAALADGAARDVRLLPGDMRHEEFVDRPSAEAAVLVAVTDRAEPGLILTQRTTTMRHHAGQVAFPGGRIDPDDDGAVAAALREAWEEIALPVAAVDVVGTADPYKTVTGFRVTPVIGVIAPNLPLVPHEIEVADVFEVPFALAMDPANHVKATAEWQGRKRHYYEIRWQDRRIWGATAAMIVNLSRRLQWRG